MQAAEAALASKTVKETTIREIAAAAGTNEAMINYYFGGKEGLMIALFQEMYKNNPNHSVNAVSDACISSRSIRPLVESLANFYHSRPNLIKMVILEIAAESSKIKAMYDKKFAAETPRFIRIVVDNMIDSGIYSPDINVKFTTMSLMSMLVAPNFLTPAAQALEMSDKLDSKEWVDHVADTIDRSARLSAH
jgi:AcrR family transcriptional regulator